MAFGDRAKHVGAQHEAVIHRDRHVPIDAHAVARLAALLMRLVIARAAAMRASPSSDDMRLPPRIYAVAVRNWPGCED